MPKGIYERKKPVWNKGLKLGSQPKWLVEKRTKARSGYTHSYETRKKNK